MLEKIINYKNYKIKIKDLFIVFQMNVFKIFIKLVILKIFNKD